jgi:PKD repeat protein
LFAAANGGTPGYTIYWDNSWVGVGPHTDTLMFTTTYNIFAVDTNGCQSPTVALTVVVNPPISITAPNVTICDGATALVSATATGGNGGPYTYTWSNGPTGSSQVVSPPAAVSPVDYIVTVSDGCSMNMTDTVTVTVNPTPVAFLTANDTSGCEDLFVSFTGLSNIGQTYIWDFGDGSNTVTGTNPSHTYTSPGVFDVTLTVITAQGCSTVVYNCTPGTCGKLHS